MNAKRLSILVALLVALATLPRGREPRIPHRLNRDAIPNKVAPSLPASMNVPSRAEPKPVGLGSKIGAEAARRAAQNPGTFVPNQGQLDPRAKFLLKDRNVSVFFTTSGWTLAAASEETGVAIQAEFVGGRDVEPQGTGLSEARVNHYVGNPEQWRVGLPTYRKVVYPDVWPGIDVLFEPRSHGVEYSFLVKPGGSVESVRLAYRGADRDALGGSGERILETALGRLTESPPRSYQEGSEIASRFRANADGTWGFEIARYDASRPLVIDPTLSWSTFLGGTLSESGNAIAVDVWGNVYVTGTTSSVDFPTTAGAFQPKTAGITEVGVTKIKAGGRSLEWSTYLGGKGWEEGLAIAVDMGTNVYVAGVTTSSDFPTTPGGYQTVLKGAADGFVAKLNPNGLLEWSTYLGGAGWDHARALAVDEKENVYVGGGTSSLDFPTTPGAFQPALAGDGDGFVTRVNSGGGSLGWSTYLGGTDVDNVKGLAVDALGNGYVTGLTVSGGFPTTPGAYSGALKGGTDAFVTMVKAGGASLVWSTLLGGLSGEDGYSIAVDDASNVYVGGRTSSVDFPTTAGALSEIYGGGLSDGFITKFDPAGGITWSSYLGGSDSDSCEGLAVDPLSEIVYVTGPTLSTDFPTTWDAYQAANAGSYDAFVTVVDPGGGWPQWSTYFGGSEGDVGTAIAADPSGVVYVTGGTGSSDFPITAAAYQMVHAGGSTDAFIARFEP